jgi:hypothetical protein
MTSPLSLKTKLVGKIYGKMFPNSNDKIQRKLQIKYLRDNEGYLKVKYSFPVLQHQAMKTCAS